jgi:hypothetical protein
MTIPFWSNDPSILFKREYILEIWPMTNMTYEQKMNAITRLILIITILVYIFTQSLRILIIGIITIVLLFVMHKLRKQKITKEIAEEGFTINADADNMDNGYKQVKDSNSFTDTITLEKVLKNEFKEGTKKNPFSNVLLTEINDDPNRKAAPPSFNVDVSEDITKNVKKSVQMMNPGINNTNKQLYGDLWNNFELDQSNRIFFSTANTRVTSDQTSFAKFLYGDMPSAKGSSLEDNLQREKDNYRYILY